MSKFSDQIRMSIKLSHESKALEKQEKFQVLKSLLKELNYPVFYKSEVIGSNIG